MSNSPSCDFELHVVGCSDAEEAQASSAAAVSGAVGDDVEACQQAGFSACAACSCPQRSAVVFLAVRWVFRLRRSSRCRTPDHLPQRPCGPPTERICFWPAWFRPIGCCGRPPFADPVGLPDMKIASVFAPIFEPPQKLIFAAERVGLAAGCLRPAFGGKKQSRHRFKCAPLNARKPPECFAFQLFDRIKSHRRPLWQQRIEPSLIEGYARGLILSTSS